MNFICSRARNSCMGHELVVSKDKKYYFIDLEGYRKGPIDKHSLYSLFLRGKLTQSTIIEDGIDAFAYSELLEKLNTVTKRHKVSYHKSHSYFRSKSSEPAVDSSIVNDLQSIPEAIDSPKHNESKKKESSYTGKISEKPKFFSRYMR